MRRLSTPIAGTVKWLIVAAAIFGGTTQPLYFVVPLSAQQIEECLSRRSNCATADDSSECTVASRQCSAETCRSAAQPPCSAAPDGDSATRPRCCSLIATQPGVEGSRLSIDDGASRIWALLPVTTLADIPIDIGVISDDCADPPGHQPAASPPSRAPPPA